MNCHSEERSDEESRSSVPVTTIQGVIMFLWYTTEDENVGQVANLSYAQAIF